MTTIPKPPSGAPDWRNELVRQVEQGTISADELVQMVARWLTSDDIYRMLHLNEMTPRLYQGQWLMADNQGPLGKPAKKTDPAVYIYLCSGPIVRDDRKHSLLEVCETDAQAAARVQELSKEMGLPYMGNGSNPADAVFN